MPQSDFAVRYGPWALVAGASEGLGAAFATQLAAQGFNLILVARRQTVLDELSAQLTSAHKIEIRTVALDLAREDAGSVLAEASAGLEVGLLVYNAAVSMIGPYFETALADHQREIAVNCYTPLTLAYLFGKPMLERGHGGIILMSSMSGAQGSPLLANYAATKAYNRVLAEGLWEELRKQGIDVLTCIPASVATPGYIASAPKGSMPALAPAAVVSAALSNLGKAPSVIPGWTWRLASFFMQRVLPHRSAITIMGNATRSIYTN